MTLAQVIAILHGVVQITADMSAQDLECPEFLVTLKFSRNELRKYGATEFADREPTPTFLLEGIIALLQTLAASEARERAWSNSQPPGMTLQDCVSFLEGEILRNRHNNGFSAGITRSLHQRTVVYLKELLERREYGGYRNPYEERQNADSTKWRFEDSREAEELRKEQERKRRRAEQDSYGNRAFEDGFRGYNEYFRDAYESAFKSYFHDFGQAAPNPPDKRHWYEVLGVVPGATRREIKTAVRRLRSKYHPDRYKHADAHARMTEINVACDEALGGAKQ